MREINRFLFFVIIFWLSIQKSLSFGQQIILQDQEKENSNQKYIIVEAKRKPKDEEWKKFNTVTLDILSGFQKNEAKIKFSKYGGLTDQKVEATGFFHTKKIENRWWLVDPEGCLFYTMGINSVRPLRSEEGKEVLKQKFQFQQNWAEQTTKLMWDNEFNTLGCWSRWQAFVDVTQRIPYTIQLNFMSSYGRKRGGTYQSPGNTGYPEGAIFVFDPEFETFANDHAKKLIETKDDPYLFGIFSDNEMPLRSDLLDRYLRLPKDDHGNVAAKNWLSKRNGNNNPESFADEDREAFIEYVVDRYFSIVGKAIKMADPNHLYLGSRFHGSAVRLPAVFKGAGPYVDVISINLYNVWTPGQERMDQWLEWSGKPFILTEWYAKGMDSGLANNSGAGWTVKTQEDRGKFYQNFTLALLRNPGCVGWHWFKYQDNDPFDKSADPSNVDSNKGIVNFQYEPYQPLLKAMHEINRQAYYLLDFFK